MATQNESILALLRLTETKWVPKWPIESLFDSIVWPVECHHTRAVSPTWGNPLVPDTPLVPAASIFHWYIMAWQPPGGKPLTLGWPTLCLHPQHDTATTRGNSTQLVISGCNTPLLSSANITVATTTWELHTVNSHPGCPCGAGPAPVWSDWCICNIFILFLKYWIVGNGLIKTPAEYHLSEFAPRLSPPPSQPSNRLTLWLLTSPH